MTVDLASDESIVAIEELLPPGVTEFGGARGRVDDVGVQHGREHTVGEADRSHTGDEFLEVVDPVDDRARGLQNGEMGGEVDREEPCARYVARQVLARRE